MTILYLQNYSINLFPIISKNWGGARCNPSQINTKEGTITGNILNENSNWLTLIIFNGNSFDNIDVSEIDSTKIEVDSTQNQTIEKKELRDSTIVLRIRVEDVISIKNVINKEIL